MTTVAAAGIITMTMTGNAPVAVDTTMSMATMGHVPAGIIMTMGMTGSVPVAVGTTITTTIIWMISCRLCSAVSVHSIPRSSTCSLMR